MKFVTDAVNLGLCTGCGTCAGACPSSAITMQTKHGLLLPVIDVLKCKRDRGCGVCANVCAGLSIDIDQYGAALFPGTEADYHIGRFSRLYTGYATDPDVRYHAASGGVVTQLLISLLQNHDIEQAVVTGFSTEYPLEPQVRFAGTREEIISGRSSKYCPVPVNAALKEIREGRTGSVAVVGLPCHIHGFRKAETVFAKLKERVTLYVGLYCSSIKSFYGTDYLMGQFGIKKNEIESFAYRDEGCLGSMVVRLKSGEIRKYPYTSYYPSLRSFFIPKRCTFCIDQTAELADISVGDIHIPEFWHDKIGVSSVIARSNRGCAYLGAAEKAGYLHLQNVEKEKIVKSQWPMLERKKYETATRSFLYKLVGRRTPEYGTASMRSSSTKKRIRHAISSLVLDCERAIGGRVYLWPLIGYLHTLARRIGR